MRNISIELLINFNKTALQLAIENENIEIVKLLLNKPKIDVNILCVYILIFLYNSKLIILNDIFVQLY